MPQAAGVHLWRKFIFLIVFWIIYIFAFLYLIFPLSVWKVKIIFFHIFSRAKPEKAWKVHFSRIFPLLSHSKRAVDQERWNALEVVSLRELWSYSLIFCSKSKPRLFSLSIWQSYLLCSFVFVVPDTLKTRVSTTSHDQCLYDHVISFDNLTNSLPCEMETAFLL